MKAQVLSSLTIFCLSGIAQGQEPTRLDVSGVGVEQAGYMYFNVATGERLTTLQGYSGSESGSGSGEQQLGVGEAQMEEIWINGTSNMCESFGSTGNGGIYWNLDRPEITNSTGQISPARWNNILVNWGDIAENTVVDMVQIHWVSSHIDADENSDGFPDGIEGFSANWTFYDGMDIPGVSMASTAQPIISFRFHTLPGILQNENDPPIAAMSWVMDVDLGYSIANSLTFEIGDTDSDLQGAAHHNARMDLRDEDSDSIPDIDPDQDGLADWGWSVQFTQPGTIDVDNADGDSDSQTGIDGDPSAWAEAGILVAAPTPGHAELFDPGPGFDPEYIWVSDGPTAGAVPGLFALGETAFPDGSGGYSDGGTYDFGGLDCSGLPGQVMVSPLASFAIVLYQDTSSGQCQVDINGDGVANFVDVSAFVAAFQAGSMIADFNGDGVIGFPDVSAFVTAFQAGCP